MKIELNMIVIKNNSLDRILNWGFRLLRGISWFLWAIYPIVDSDMGWPTLRSFSLLLMLQLDSDLCRCTSLNFRLDNPDVFDVNPKFCLQHILDFVRSRVCTQTCHRNIPIIFFQKLHPCQIRLFVCPCNGGNFLVLNCVRDNPRASVS
jgi:hypothetical protein